MEKSHSIYREWVKCVTRTRIRKAQVGILRIAEKNIYRQNKRGKITEIIRYKA